MTSPPDDRAPLLVTGATGDIGSELVRLLAATGEATRVLIRKPQQAEALRQRGVEPVVGDFNDPASLDAAVQGCDRLFLLSPPSPEQAQREKRVIDAAVGAGVKRVVKLSAADANLGASVPWAQAHAEIDAYLHGSGLTWTILKPTAFMQNFFSLAPVIAKGRLFHIAREGRVSYIDARDIAMVAARVLTEAGHEGATYFLTGPEALTMREVAARFSLVLERRVTYRNVPALFFHLRLRLAGVSGWLAGGLVEQFGGVVAGGHAVAVTGEVKRLTGREPRTFMEFAQDHKTTFAEA